MRYTSNLTNLVRPSVSNKDLKKQNSLELTKKRLEIEQNISKMLHNNNLNEMSLRLNRSEPLFRTIRELPGIGKRPRTRGDIRLHRNLPFNFMVVRQTLTQIFIFRILLAMNLDFHLQT